MNTFLALFLIIAAIAASVAFVASTPRGKQLSALCNVADGFQPATRTFLADALFPERYLLVRTGSSSQHIALCGVGDIPKAYTIDRPDIIGDAVACSTLGLGDTAALGVASGTIAQDAFLVAGAAGTVRTLPAVAGSYHIIGRATQAAVNTDTVEYVPCFPVLRVVV